MIHRNCPRPLPYPVMGQFPLKIVFLKIYIIINKVEHLSADSRRPCPSIYNVRRTTEHMPGNKPALPSQCRRVQPCECNASPRHSHCLPRDYHPRSSWHTSRRGTYPLATGASAGPAGKGYHEITGTESCHGDGLFSKDPFPANVCLIVRLSSRLPAPRPILPQRYQVWPPALPRQAPWSSQRHTFGASPRPLEAVPSWGTGKFLRTHMTAIPGKVARFHAVCAAPAPAVCLCP